MKRSIAVLVVGILLLAAAAPAGADWTPRQRLGPGGSPSIAVVGDTVHVVWSRPVGTGTNREIYYARSDDAGDTWNPPQRLSGSARPSLLPDIAAAGDGIHVAWIEMDLSGSNRHLVFYRRSADGGDTWDPPGRVGLCGWYKTGPAIAAAEIPGGETAVHLVWSFEAKNMTVPEVLYSRSLDGGDTWSRRVRLSRRDQQWGNWPMPDIAAEGESVHVVYRDWTDNATRYDVYTRRSEDSGASWSAARRLSRANEDSWGPVVAANDGAVHVTWMDEANWLGSPSRQVWHRASLDAGATWERPSQLTRSGGASEWPSVAVSRRGTVHVTWAEGYTFADPDADVFYRQSNDGGATWGARRRVDPACNFDERPVVAVDGPAQAHLAWGYGAPLFGGAAYYRSSD